jgi:hypothetical protein
VASESLLILERDVRKDLEVLERLWDQLDAARPSADAGDEHMVAVAYRLHNVYSGCGLLPLADRGTPDRGRGGRSP